jgi:small ligand-binding sensory domain FIST
MRWGSAVSTAASVEAAVDEVVSAVKAQLGGARPDLAVVFASEHHRQGYERIPALVRARLAPGALVGCSAGGVIGGGREIEGRPGLSLTAALLPGVTLTPLHLENDQVPGAADSSPSRRSAWPPASTERFPRARRSAGWPVVVRRRVTTPSFSAPRHTGRERSSWC